MSNTPFSLRLDAALKARLDKEARNQDRSSSYIATKAIELFLDERDRMRTAIEHALVEANKGGRFLSCRTRLDGQLGWRS